MPSIGQYEKIRALASNARVVVTAGVRAQSATEVVFYDHAADKMLGFFEAPGHVFGLALAGETVLAACADGYVHARRLDAQATPVRSIAAHTGGCTAVAVAPDNDRVATVGADGALRLFSLASGKKLGEWTLSGQALRAVAVDPSGEYAAAAGDDGVVRVITLANGAKREMSGHTGPVYALAFTPRDGRLASGGDDGTIRIWYIVGDVEFEQRGGDESGHAGAVTALLFPSTPDVTPGQGEAQDRIVSAGADGKIKFWQLETRRKPRTLDTGNKPLYALAFAPAPANLKASSLGYVFAGGDSRSVYRYNLDLTGAPSSDNASATYAHAFAVLAANLTGARPARESTVKTLAEAEEPEALELLLKALGTDREPEVRALAAQQLGARQRRAARAALRERLDDDHALVRNAAFAALRAIDGPASLLPLRAALASRHAEMRVAALRELVALRDSSPLVPGLIADKLTDGAPTVRLAALDQLTRLHPANSPEPLRLAYERGPADLKIEVLIRAASAGLLSNPGIAPTIARALDDTDGGVRRLAFAVKVLERKALVHALEARDEDLGRAVNEIARRVAQLAQAKSGAAAQGAPAPAATPAGAAPATAKGPTDDEIKAARAGLPGVGNAGAAPSDADLEPLLIALACRTADTALRGARGLAQLGDTRALGALLQISRETDATLRREAARALAELSDPRAQKRLVWMLDDADASVRAAALDAYAKLEKAPLVVAESALRSAFEDIRVRGLDQLVKLGTAGGLGAVQPPGGGVTAPATPGSDQRAHAEVLLGNALEDESAKVRGEAFRTLWAWHDKDPVKALDRALDARFPDLRSRAVDELATHGKEGWALERLRKTISDRDANVALAAHAAVVKLQGKEDAEAHLGAMGSVHPMVRLVGAREARNATLAAPDAGSGTAAAGAAAPNDKVRDALTKLLADTAPEVRVVALESLDKLLPGDAGPHHAALQSNYLDLRVRAAELLAVRHDEALIDPMRALLSDKDLAKGKIPAQLSLFSGGDQPQQVLAAIAALRQRAASALATLGAPRTVRYLATELLKDDAAEVREQAARGLATAARRGDEGYLLDALGHADAWVRSWAADGLSRLGDVRALPVLTGNLRHDHLPIRKGAILSFAALGPEGFGGMLQGLEDKDREVQEMVFAIVLARDLRAFRRGAAPELLTSALSSGRAEVRFAAARALELRTQVEDYVAHVIEVLMPPMPEKVSDMKDWPQEQTRGRILVGLADALAGDVPEQRYAAAQVLNLKHKPLEYFREAQKAARLRSVDAPWVPDTTPRAHAEDDAKAKKGWLRRLFSGDDERGKERAGGAGGPTGERSISADEQLHLQRLAFGAYVGLLRQSTAGDDEGHRVRRDSVDRIVELGLHGRIGVPAAVPAVVRALDDPHHLVRKAAFAGLKKLFPKDADEPLSLALASASADVARAALDELAQGGDKARGRIAAALNSRLPEVRRYAFELLEKLSPKGSLEPLLAALSSEHADLRIGVVQRLASSNDARVTAALLKALESDHDDLRLTAAELLADRKDDRTVDVLAAFLRADDAGAVSRATGALVRLGSAAAVRALAARLEEITEPNARAALVTQLGRTRNAEALEPLCARFDDEAAQVRSAASDAVLDVVGRDRTKRDDALAIRAFGAEVHAKDPTLRVAAATELAFCADARANDLLVGLFPDRDPLVRREAVQWYSKRVLEKGAPVAPLEAVLKAGARELVLPAAEGVASKGNALALRPLLLVVRAGEPAERQRALLALGSLGDPRALEELETVAAGGTPEAPVEQAEQAAATEALGRIAGKLTDVEARKRVVDKVEQAAADNPAEAIRASAVRGLRWIGGERARAKLEAILADGGSPGAVAVAAATELGELSDKSAEAALGRALDHGNSYVRTAARKALDKLFPDERTRVEFLAVDSRYTDVSQQAAAFLATEGDPALLVPRLATLKNPQLRQRLRYGLVRRGVVPVAQVAALLGNEQPAVREEVAWLLGACVGSDGAGKLSDTDRGTLARALAGAEDRAEKAWTAAKQGPAREAEARAWSRALWAASRLGAEPKELVARARKALAGGEVKAPAAVRREAARALTARGSAADAEVLAAALGDLDPGVRTAAAEGLARHAPDRALGLAAKVVPFDAVAFGPTAESRAARDAALGDPAARRIALPAVLTAHEIKPLAALTDKRHDAETRLAAVQALGRAGGRDAMDLLKTLAFDKSAADEALRKAAWRAFKRAQRAAAHAKKYEAQA